MPSLDPLGSVFNIVGSPTGRHIILTNATGATFMSFLEAGTQGVTVKESIDGSSEQALSVIDTIYKAPGVGGTWTKVTQTASDTYTHADSTNDCIAITVLASELSDGFNCVEFTTSGSPTFSHVLVHGLSYPAAAAALSVPVA